MMKKFYKKDNLGITLIALVITIVVLIILAGVIISITISNGGMIDRAKLAKQEYTNAEGYEQEQIAKATNEIDGYVDGNRDLASQTSGTATAADILQGKTAWVNGQKITGTLRNDNIRETFSWFYYYDYAGRGLLLKEDGTVTQSGGTLTGNKIRSELTWGGNLSVYAVQAGKFRVTMTTSDSGLSSTPTTEDKTVAAGELICSGSSITYGVVEALF